MISSKLESVSYALIHELGKLSFNFTTRIGKSKQVDAHALYSHSIKDELNAVVVVVLEKHNQPVIGLLQNASEILQRKYNVGRPLVVLLERYSPPPTDVSPTAKANNTPLIVTFLPLTFSV